MVIYSAARATKMYMRAVLSVGKVLRRFTVAYAHVQEYRRALLTQGIAAIRTVASAT